MADGHMSISLTNRANCLRQLAWLFVGYVEVLFVVFEAKLFSLLSKRVTNAPFFDQVALNVACIAEVWHRAGRVL